MDPKKYNLAHRAFMEVCDLEAGERTRRLRLAVGDDPELEAVVRGMLAQDQVAAAERVATRPPFDGLLLGADDPVTPEEVPEFIGPYRVIRRIGEGGMGTVYEAEQDQPRRRVAIKVMRRGMASGRGRFLREIETLGRLQHPGIARVYGAGVAVVAGSDAPYFAMEFVDGVTLTRFADEQNLAMRERLGLIAATCDAVHAAHQRGVVHRDLKPQNVLAERRPTDANAEYSVKILDFGIARVVTPEDHSVSMRTEAGQIIGTICYMSPEQLHGEPATIDTRSDVYALGVLLYELLSGRLPHDVRSLTLPEAARIVAFDPPTRLSTLNPNLRGDVESIVAKALEPDRQRRYQSASELASDIRRFLRDEPVTARPLTMMYQLRKFASRNPGLAWGVGVAAAGLLIGAVSTAVALVGSIRNESRAIASEAAARRSEAQARAESYRLALAAADASAAPDPVRSRRLLDEVPAEMRGWEWHHYRSRLERTTQVIPGDSVATAAIGGASGASIAVCREGRVEIVDIESESRRVLSASDGFLSRPVFSGSGSRLAALEAASDGAVSVVVYEEDRPVAQLSAGTVWDEPRMGLSFDGCTMWIEDSSQGFRIMDTDSGTTLWARPPAPLGTRRIGLFRSDGQFEWCVLDAEARRAESPDGAVSRDLAFDLMNSLDHNATITLRDPDGTLDKRAVEIYDALGQRIAVLTGHTRFVTAAAISPDGTLIATAAADNTIRVWDTAGVCRTVIPIDPIAVAVRWGARGESLLCADDRGGAFVVTLAEPCVRTLRGHTSFVYFAAFSPDSTLIASASWADAVRVWNSSTGSPVAVLDRSFAQIYPPVMLGFTRDGTRLFVQEQGDSVSTWSVQGVSQGVTRREPESPVIRTLRDDPWSVAASSTRWCRLQGGQVRAVSPRGDLLAFESGPGNVKIRDVHSGRGELCEISTGEHSVSAVAVSPDGSLLATSSEGPKISVWSLPEGKLVRTLSRHEGPVFSLDFSPDGSRLASAGEDTVVLLWHTGSWEPLAELRGHTKYVSAVSFSTDGTQIVTASGDGTVKVWDTLSPRDRSALLRSAGLDSSHTNPAE
ncbi:MAG: serine/threonine protein kinase [Planctomycetes bacterium]|nr:serine/threonine protein kinase [Planctomycetota bacterium]